MESCPHGTVLPPLPPALQRQDRVAIWAPNCAEWATLQYAAARVGEGATAPLLPPQRPGCECLVGGTDRCLACCCAQIGAVLVNINPSLKAAGVRG